MNVRLSIVGLVAVLMLAWVPSSFGRWFDAERGQWLSRDQAGYIDGPNLYAYVGDSPIVMRDPSGLGCQRGSAVEPAVWTSASEAQRFALIDAIVPPFSFEAADDLDLQNLGSGYCRRRCPGYRRTYRAFMLGFTGSQLEADRCCDSALGAAAAVGCCVGEPITGAKYLYCQGIFEGTFVACVVLLPGS